MIVKDRQRQARINYVALPADHVVLLHPQCGHQVTPTKVYKGGSNGQIYMRIEAICPTCDRYVYLSINSEILDAACKRRG
jgi:hypothetical protein